MREPKNPAERGRKRPWSKTSPVAPRGGVWDAIVIGSGMGGMTTAALLAQLGQQVLVLEQHYVAGGFTHMFKRPGYSWDVGVHAVGEVTERSLTGRLLAKLTGGSLRWASLGPVYDEFEFPDGFHIDFPDDPARFRDNLIAAAPREAAAIDEYLRLVREVAAGMKRYYLARVAPHAVARAVDFALARPAQRYLELGTRQVIESLTADPRLRTLMAAQWGYYGSTPSRSSFAIQALVVRHFMHGGYYPVGGARRIAETLLETVAAAGGWTRVATDVAEIVVERGRAVGVRLDDGEVIRARRVISAAGVRSTVERLLPGELRDAAWARSVRELRPASAHVCLYLGFKGDVRAAGAGAANQWFYHTWSTEADAWDVGADGPRGEAPVLYCSFPSLKDPEHDPGPEQRHTGEVVTFAPWDAFARWQDQAWKKRGEDYEALKAKLTASLLEQLFRHRPGLRPLLDYAELSTPLSTDNFCRPVAGSIYGLEPTPARFRNPWLRPRSPVPGLFFSGSDVASVGVIGAMMGGVLAAAAAEPVGTIRSIRDLR